MTYSRHYRDKVLSYRASKRLTIAQTASHFSIGVASIVRWLKRLEPQRTLALIDIHKLAQDIPDVPDAYPLPGRAFLPDKDYERAQRLGVSVCGICDATKRMGITYKSLASSKGGQRQTAQLPILQI